MPIPDRHQGKANDCTQVGKEKKNGYIGAHPCLPAYLNLMNTENLSSRWRAKVKIPSKDWPFTQKDLFLTVNPRRHAVLPGGDVVVAGEVVEACNSSPRRYSSASSYRLTYARPGIAPRRAGSGLYLLGQELSLAEQVQACTGLPGITPRRPGTSFYRLAEKLSLGERVPACTGSPKNNSLASWYKPVPARRGVIPRRAGTSRSRRGTTSPPGKTACRRGFIGVLTNALS
ncbi:hypothetical protein PCANC_18534 [Puccinia coronata f. sp. avenae]|uniref:Uncharacterized protein n=1 Tax=Puccinia coronata f. sp. avenae TaxID=200324 RepID=A0A2N5SB13_9BASI|nr:hypothetical protein PCANC_18534 [Puccinia coronata f. sp. avenae]